MGLLSKKAQFWAVFFIVAIVLAEIAEAKKKSCNVCKCVCKYKKNKKGYGALYKKTVYKKKPSYPYAHSSSSSSSGYRRSDDDEGSYNIARTNPFAKEASFGYRSQQQQGHRARS